MPELRHDALTGRLVLLAPSRSTRPHTAPPVSDAAGAAGAGCPFCPGHEHETPPEVARAGGGEPDEPGWRVRVVPNLFPIVGGPDAQASATGAHEVIVLSPEHDRDFALLDTDQAAEVLTLARARARAHSDAGHAHLQLFVNHGRAAGASIAHPHAQLVALDFVPPAVSVAVERFGAAASDLVVDDQVAAIDAGAGIVDGDAVRAWCPLASAAPFEARVAVLDAGARFEDATDGQVLGAAVVVRDVLAAMGAALGHPAYNVIVHNGPSAGSDSGDPPFHWWIEVLPRLGVVAGFELGTGVLVNTTDPVDAAARLRVGAERGTPT